ncbi:MAG: ATP-binding protein [Micropepsaceae bacterium]
MATSTFSRHGQQADASAPAVGHLIELGAHFALAERAARIGYWRHEIDSDVLHWSPGLFAIVGADPLTARPSFEILLHYMLPDDQRLSTALIAEARATGKSFRYRTRHSSRSNPQVRVFETHGEVERNPHGRVVAVLGVVREVTEEVDRECALKEREATYRFMTEAATDIIVRHRPDGAPVFISHAVESILGYRPEELLGSAPFQHTHPDDLACTMASIMEAKETGKPITYMYRARHKLGHYVWLESTVRFAESDNESENGGAISVTRDVSKRKLFEDELLQARERAESANHTKTRFLANMSHELRTPLNAIIGFSDIMVREMFGPMSNMRYAEYANLVHESGALLLDLINDLLDMSKIEAGKYELHFETFHADEALNTGLQLLRTRAQDKGIEISTQVAPQNLCVRADRRVFKQVLLNLVSNAVKFTNPGGKIFVGASEIEKGVQLLVRDNGIGIPAEFLPRIAQPFEQASNDPARTHGGSGLGLALVKSLIALHGGEFNVQSKLGHGTEVTVTLPLSPDSRATSAA